MNQKIEEAIENIINRPDASEEIQFYTNFDWFETDYLWNYRRNFNQISFIEYLGIYYNFYQDKSVEFSLFSNEKEMLSIMEIYKTEINELEMLSIMEIYKTEINELEGVVNPETIKKVFLEISYEIDKILRFLDREIFNLKLNSGNIEEVKPDKAVFKIRMLHETGIIEFLNNKFPHTSDRAINNFFAWLTDNSIKDNRSSEFTIDKTNEKHPLTNMPPLERKKLSEKMEEFKFK